MHILKLLEICNDFPYVYILDHAIQHLKTIYSKGRYLNYSRLQNFWYLFIHV